MLDGHHIILMPDPPENPWKISHIFVGITPSAHGSPLSLSVLWFGRIVSPQHISFAADSYSQYLQPYRVFADLFAFLPFFIASPSLSPA
jgi:hypothetical protein